MRAEGPRAPGASVVCVCSTHSSEEGALGLSAHGHLCRTLDAWPHPEPPQRLLLPESACMRGGRRTPFFGP